MEALQVPHVQKIIEEIADSISCNVDNLTVLDSVAGDGDHGITIRDGWIAVRERARQYNGDDIGMLIMACGNTLCNSYPSTMGSLLGMSLIKAGECVKGKSTITLGDIVLLSEILEKTIRELGGASEGDRTMLDALCPAVRSLKRSTGERDLVSAFTRATQAAYEGMVATASLLPKAGRAIWVGERALGNYDAGAASVYYMLSAVTNAIAKIVNEG